MSPRFAHTAWLSLPLFCSLVFNLSTNTLHAESVRLLVDGTDAFETRLDLIHAAEQSLDIAYFCIDQDACSSRFLLALQGAALRGVNVRLVVDDRHNHMSTAHQTELLAAGVQLRTFHPKGTGLRNLLHRMHDKYLAADGARLIMGSRNIANGYYEATVGREAYIDLDVLVEGAWVGSTHAYFDALWHSSHLAAKIGTSVATVAAGVQSGSSSMEAGVAVSAFASTPVQHRSPTLEVFPAALRFVHDSAGTKVKQAGAATGIYAALESARSSILIVTPYFLPADRLGDILLRAAERGVRVQVLTNSLESTNRSIQHAGFLNVSRRFVRRGIDIREFQGPETLHAKAFVVDGQVAGITTFNFNRRSAMTDTEIGLVIRDTTFAQMVGGELQRLMQRSTVHVPAGLGRRRAVRMGARVRNEAPMSIPRQRSRTHQGKRRGIVRVHMLRAAARTIPNQL